MPKKMIDEHTIVNRRLARLEVNLRCFVTLNIVTAERNLKSTTTSRASLDGDVRLVCI